jgi:hypothetical protein
MKLAMIFLTTATMTVTSMQFAAAGEQRVRHVDRHHGVVQTLEALGFDRAARGRDAYAYDALRIAPDVRVRIDSDDYLQALAEGGAIAAPAGR